MDSSISELNKLLFDAAQKGDTATVVRLIESEQVKIDALNHIGWTALHMAAFYNYITTVDYLIMSGAKIDLFDKNGFTPFMNAAWRNNEYTAFRLLSAMTPDQMAEAETYPTCNRIIVNFKKAILQKQKMMFDFLWPLMTNEGNKIPLLDLSLELLAVTLSLRFSEEWYKHRIQHDLRLTIEVINTMIEKRSEPLPSVPVIFSYSFKRQPKSIDINEDDNTERKLSKYQIHL